MLILSANRQHLLFIQGCFYLLVLLSFVIDHATSMPILYPLCKIQWDVYGICALTFIMDLGHGQTFFFFNVNLEYYNKNGAQLLMKTKPHPLTLCDCGLNTSHTSTYLETCRTSYSDKSIATHTRFWRKKNLLFWVCAINRMKRTRFLMLAHTKSSTMGVAVCLLKCSRSFYIFSISASFGYFKCTSLLEFLVLIHNAHFLYYRKFECTSCLPFLDKQVVLP